jgi:hypothetical protein
MSRNGSGVYSLPAGNPVVTGTTISSSWANSTLSDIATALTGSVAADGQTAMTGNLQMGNNKVTGLANGSSSTDAAAYGQITGGINAGSFTTLAASSTLTVTGAGSIQGLTVGRGAGAIATNTAVGNAALFSNSTGADNTAIGNFSQFPTTGSSNTSLGSAALRFNTSGSFNSAVGHQALNSNTTASNNTAVGYQSAYANTTGQNIVAIGYRALTANTTGSRNSAVGLNALFTNTTGSDNSASGNGALGFNTTGSYNSAYGSEALLNNTTASLKTAVGYQAGFTGTTNSSNIYLGAYAGYNSTGTLNTFVGPDNAGSAMTTGNRNTIIGNYGGNSGGLDIRTANNYIVLSDGDGNPRGIFDNNGNYLVGVTSTSSSVAGHIATKGFATRSGSSGSFSGQVFNINWTGNPILWIDTTNVGQIAVVSDYRLKENVVAQTEKALDKVMQLQPVKFNRKSIGIFGGSTNIEEGFIAHELQAIIPSAVTGEKDALTEDGTIQPQSLNWSPVVSVLVKAIQELKAEVDSLKQQLNNGV